jgi:hypothetical protein
MQSETDTPLSAVHARSGEAFGERVKCDCAGAQDRRLRGSIPMVTMSALLFDGAIRSWSIAVETCGHCSRVLKGIQATA